MNYDESVRYLLTLGRELASPQQALAAKFDLENIRAVCAKLDHPERAFRSVHVAGTNGKGSTSAMLASMLTAAGLRAGLYTSPHLVRINERIRIGNAEIGEQEFAAAFARVRAAIEELLAAGTLLAHPTYFECVTAMAFDYFARQNVDLAVVEVGMGGRLDSTNIITPEVAVITRIDFDHENFLGHSIEEIAGEKAGIIKPGAWVVSAAGHPIAAGIVRRRSAEENGRLIEVDSACTVSELRSEGGRYHFRVATPGFRSANPAAPASLSPSPPELEIALPLAGRFQVRNALTAIAAARLLGERGFLITDAAIEKGLATVRWPGRLERVSERPAVYLDGTHNPAGARELVAFWEEQFPGRRIYLIYGAMRDKAVDEVAGLLFPHATHVILTQSPQPRSISAATLASLTQHLAPSAEVIPEPATALERAIELAAPEDVVFATGSLYLVGDLRRYWSSCRSANSTRVSTLGPP
jgi:dihydrofolate synthase / folylpolyglutamate synthase